MAEVVSPNGTWTLNAISIRIVPGQDRGVHKLRKALGELTVPLEAVAGVAYEPGRKGGRLRMRMREGADPLAQAARGQLPDNADPYQLAVGADQVVAAEYLADAARFTPTHDGRPLDRYLLPGPHVPVTASVGEGGATFDGRAVHLDWSWQAPEAKKRAGPQELALEDIAGVDWRPNSGLNDGLLRFRKSGAPTNLGSDKDPHCLRLNWGTANEFLTALVAAAVVARLPHPLAPPEKAQAPPSDVDEVLVRLRELGDLHKTGVLDDEEFAAAKQALLRRLGA